VNLQKKKFSLKATQSLIGPLDLSKLDLEVVIDANFVIFPIIFWIYYFYSDFILIFFKLFSSIKTYNLFKGLVNLLRMRPLYTYLKNKIKL